jgi:hypothetical protein
MNDFTIRRAASPDVERIVELGLLLQEHVEESNPFVWRITEEGKKLIKQKVEADLANSNVLVLIAEADGEVIGYVQGEVTSRSDHVPGTVGQVSLMYVVKQFRRRYVIGNKEAEGFWRKLGFEPIITTSRTSATELDHKLRSW